MFKIREIQDRDYQKGYLKVINVFTKNPIDVSYNDFVTHLRYILNQNSVILVAEQDDVIIGTLKILKEYKLHNNLTCMAHIEDVAVLPEYRGMKVATSLLNKALTYTNDCYKVVLSCKIELEPLYSSLGFVVTGKTLTLYK